MGTGDGLQCTRCPTIRPRLALPLTSLTSPVHVQPSASHVASPLPVRLCAVVVDMYAPLLGSSTTVDTLFLRLHAAIAREVGLGRDLLGLQGALDLLMAASTTGEGPATASSSASAGGGGVVGGAGTGGGGSGYDTAYTYGYVADEA